MKLSSLLHYYRYLGEVELNSTAGRISMDLNNVIGKIASSSHQYDGVLDNLLSIDKDIQKKILEFSATIDALKHVVKANIKLLELSYHKESREFYNHLRSNPNSADPSKVMPDLSDETRNYLSARLSLYNNWSHTGAIINPANGDWIESLVALDPLYLLDDDYKKIDPCLARFPTEYQNRLRRYTIDESQDLAEDTTNFCHKMPQGQLALILVYNFFNYRPVHIIAQYIGWFYSALKPGGSVIFTYNNCDYPEAVELVEKHCACYVTTQSVLDIISRLNFEVVNQFDINSSSTWVEIKKPGFLSSRRGGQSLARIVEKKPLNQ